MPTSTVLVIAGSVRRQRIGIIMANWVADLGRSSTPVRFEVIDLRDWPLPMDDEPGVPARGDYAQPHTVAWSRKVTSADGIVFVTPQYNWGYPAPLKNAIDHLYGEWRGKPATIVTYGGHGGGKCAAQLRDVLSGIKMRLTDGMPALVLPAGQIEANDGEIDPDAAFADQRDSVVSALLELAGMLGNGEAAAGGS